MIDIDDIDRKIIELLQSDASATNAEISEKIGVSEATVRRRRIHLEQEDILRVITSINPFILGYKIIIIMGIQVTPGKMSEVKNMLCSIPGVRFLGVTLGRYDLMLEAWFKSGEDLVEFTSETLPRSGMVSRTETFQIVELSKYSYDWKPPPPANNTLSLDMKLSKSRGQ
jgi:Lrp/AsnC family transcriptional regulator for asnA, asnC and gidA